MTKLCADESGMYDKCTIFGFASKFHKDNGLPRHRVTDFKLFFRIPALQMFIPTFYINTVAIFC